MEHNTHNTIKDTVLDRIAIEKVTPKSRWYFTARHAVLWSPGIAVTLLGGLAIASIIFSALHAGWEYRMVTKFSFWSFIFSVIPVIWVISLVVFGMVIVKTLRITAKGYRYTTGIILLTSFSVSFIIGVSLVALDMTVQRNNLIRFSAARSQKILWTVPEEGRIAGVLSLTGDEATLVDARGEVWDIDMSEIFEDVLLSEKNSVRLVGEVTGDHTFFACLLMPWEFTPPEYSAVVSPKRPLRDRIETLSDRCKQIVQMSRQSISNSERKIAPQP